MSSFNIIDHVKSVAKDDLRLWLAPFVAIVSAAKTELQRPSSNSTSVIHRAKIQQTNKQI